MINKIKKFNKFFNNSNKSKFNLLDTFPSFVPNSKGSYKSVEKIIIQNINNSISAINNLKSNVINFYLKTSDFPDTINAKNLKNLLDNSGSDKANHHDYHKVYNFIIEDIHNIKNILEVGMGTSNSNIVSNMGTHGKPGASLIAFSKFLQNANIYGADIDKEILFSKRNIRCFYVNQLEVETFEVLKKIKFDLIIDDGLHAQIANLNTLKFAMENLSRGGWFVVEDIPKYALNTWEIVCNLLNDKHYVRIVESTKHFMFICKINSKEIRPF